MVSFSVTAGRENGIGELSLPGAGAQQLCLSHTLSPYSLASGSPFVAISQGAKPNEMLLSPADPRAHTLGGFSPSGLFAQTSLTRAACLCCGVLEATVLRVPGPQASCPRVPPLLNRTSP